MEWLFFLYGLHAFALLWWRRRHAAGYLARLDAARAAPAPPPPRVLVQIPVYNEAPVVERAIACAAALDWPRDRLEIQVLDDSTDETAAIVDRCCTGRPIAVLRRAARDGYKAGALAAGLQRSSAEYVAVFDADFAPAPDFLRRALPLFGAFPDVACVQGRWEHLNPRQNLLTRAQAAGTDAHFHVQQLARAASGRFLNFSGTAGVWRRAAIDAAGGWSGDTLTEDLDLSYRVQLRGGRIVFDPSLAAPGELPPTLAAYKSQQRRWACGSIQCARKHLPAVWRRRDLPFAVKLEATAHLCGYAVCLAMVALLALLPFGPAAGAVWPLLVGVAGPLAVTWTGQRARGGASPLAVVAGFLLGLGACANNTHGVLRGLFRPMREFVRTPKQGTLPALPAQAPKLELALAAATAAAAGSAAPYGLLCCAGFFSVAAYWALDESRRT